MLLLPVLGAAELWTAAWRPSRKGLILALVAVLLCAGASAKLQHDAEGIAVERRGRRAPLATGGGTYVRNRR